MRPWLFHTKSQWSKSLLTAYLCPLSSTHGFRHQVYGTYYTRHTEHISKSIFKCLSLTSVLQEIWIVKVSQNSKHLPLGWWPLLARNFVANRTREAVAILLVIVLKIHLKLLPCNFKAFYFSLNSGPRILKIWVIDTITDMSHWE